MVTSAKPFSNYHTPSPISPYLYMYGPNRGSGIDNYNLMVRPMLEQQAAANVPWQMRVDNPPMASPGSEQWQGTPPSNCYMNLQQYYPGLKQHP